MAHNVNYKYISDSNILIRTFKGIVRINDIISSWEDIVAKKLNTNKYKGIITDFDNADIQIEIEEVERFANFFKKNKEILANIKMAVVMDSPKIILPLFLESENPDIQVKSFSTNDGALTWIENEQPDELSQVHY